jgi:hypothetical protein
MAAKTNAADLLIDLERSSSSFVSRHFLRASQEFRQM